MSFEFPPHGTINEGPVLGEQGRMVWQSETNPNCYVTEQRDHPAIAYRCHYDQTVITGLSGSVPCDYATMIAFIEYAENVGAHEFPDALVHPEDEDKIGMVPPKY